MFSKLLKDKEKKTKKNISMFEIITEGKVEMKNLPTLTTTELIDVLKKYDKYVNKNMSCIE